MNPNNCPHCGKPIKDTKDAQKALKALWKHGKRKKMSVTALAALVGVKAVTVYAWKSKKIGYMPNTESIAKIWEAVKNERSAR